MYGLLLRGYEMKKDDTLPHPIILETLADMEAKSMLTTEVRRWPGRRWRKSHLNGFARLLRICPRISFVS